MAPRATKLDEQTDVAETPELEPVAFELVDCELLRLSLPGGLEAALEAGQPYSTSDPAAIAALDAHPAARRIGEAN